MLDYYGSIVKSNKEIDTELITKFTNICNESYIDKIIKDLRKEDVLLPNYSVSGWNIFGRKQISLIIKIKLDHIKEINEKKLKACYCLEKFFSLNNIKDNYIIEYILNEK